jgi:4-hydroxy-tetrahydrodipicolinate reductase
MKLALIGYGKMGRVIEEIALSRGHQISARYNSANPLTAESLASADAAIEFSAPELATQHISICLNAGLPVVSGTTGWYEDFPDMAALAEKTGTALFTASNFSLGVNIFFRINEELARMMQAHPDYRVEISETHHVHKKDAPSGTAISLAEGILRRMPEYKGWMLKQDHEPETGIIPVQSYRLDEVPGTHEVRYVSDIDTLSISHLAHNRKGFALGAVLAAEFILGRSGVLGMKDLLQF